MKNLKTRARILILVTLAGLPALLLTVYEAVERRQAAERQARGEITRLVRLAALQEWQVIEGVRQMLVASAQVVSTLKDDPARCNGFFVNLLAQNRETFHSMGVIDLDGRLACGSRTGKVTASASDRSYFLLAKDTGKFAVGEYQIGRVSRLEGISFGYPIADADGKVTAVAFAAMELTSLKRMADSVPLPAGGILNVLDKNGVILARKPEPSGRLGEKLRNAPVVKKLFSARQGVFEAKGTDGIGRVFAHEVVIQNPDGGYPIRVMVSVPLEQVFADADKALVRDVLGILLATAFLLVGAWYGTELFVLRKIRALLRAADRVRAGDLNARTGLPHGREELGQIARSFDEMAEALQRRERELREQAITDPLTGLYNRRRLDELLPRELARAARAGESVAVIIVDLDRFKRINDEFGHETGDRVLTAVGELFRTKVRGSDIACRYGGEEFALVLHETGREAARRRAEDLRAAINRLHLVQPGQRAFRITASLGVALFPQHGEDPDDLLRAADEALYAAKGAGRNRVVLSGAENA
jgi:diguanylate cyclase (GGDEF)-like protein